MGNNTKSLIDFLMKNYVNKVDIAVDMTLGNGNDAKNILDILKPEKLYGFDIQKEAISNTHKLLGEEYKNYELILDSHVNIDRYIDCRIDFAIYNLGYLPSGDKNITTLSSDVILSLEKIINMLNINGNVILTFYPGHEQGMIESLEIKEYLSKLSQKNFSIIKFDFINQKNNPPFVIMINKLK